MSAPHAMVAVSGGVDSSTAAALLLEAGYVCSGVYMITHDDALHAQRDAESVCRHLGISLYILDLRPDFQRDIISYFCEEYRRGRTPNPCVLCNRLIKFGRLWEFAVEKGAQSIATGHYTKIRCIEEKYGIYQADNIAKDQSYVLSMIRREVLPHILLPMAEYTKEQTRTIAARFALPTEHKKDSQEICFIPDDDYIGKLHQWAPEINRAGDVLDTAGNVLGRHEGICRFTIGQRRGVRIAMGKPMYVVGIDAEHNTITLGEKADLCHSALIADFVNWLSDIPSEPFDAIVKIRYNHCGAAGRVFPESNGSQVRIEFNEPVSAITSGQAAVMYRSTEYGLQVVGGGWIKTAL